MDLFRSLKARAIFSHSKLSFAWESLLFSYFQISCTFKAIKKKITLKEILIWIRKNRLRYCEIEAQKKDNLRVKSRFKSFLSIQVDTSIPCVIRNFYISPLKIYWKIQIFFLIFILDSIMPKLYFFWYFLLTKQIVQNLWNSASI